MLAGTMSGASTSVLAWVLQSSSDDGDGFLVVVAGFFIGLFLIYYGFKLWRLKRLIQDTPTETVRSMAVGRTELAGTAHPRGEAFDQPFAEGAAVVAEYEIEEYEQNDEGSNWDTKDRGRYLEPFDLDDGTGTVRVDADDGLEVRYSDGATTQFTVGSTEEEPPAVEAFLREHSSVSVPDAGPSGVVFGERRRYTQKVIPPGTEVYLFGNASQRADATGTANEEALSVGRDEATGRFLLSDMDEATLTSKMATTAPLVIGVGVLVLAVGFYFALSALGIAG